MKTLALVIALVLAACGSTPGLTLKCDGHCRLIPADLHHHPDPAAMKRPNEGGFS